MRLRNKATEALWRFRYFFLFFLYSVLYSVYMNYYHLPQLTPFTYSLHLIDYSFGFCTKFLNGTLYRLLFGGNYDYGLVQNYNRAILYVGLALVALLLNEFVLSAKKENRKLYIVVCLFYLSGPSTFSFYMHTPGMLDCLWLPLAALFMLAVNGKRTKIFVPLIMLVTVMVHFSSLISYIVLYLFVLLYLMSEQKETKKKLAYGALVGVSLAAVVAMTLYFMVNEQSNVRYSMEEAGRIVMERSQIDNYTDLDYIFMDIYKVVTYENSEFPYRYLYDDVLIPAGSSVPPVIAKIVNAVWPVVDYHLSYYKSQGDQPINLLRLVFIVLFLIPVFAFIYRYWGHRIKLAKAEKKRFEQLLFVLAIVYIPVVLVVWFLCSLDAYRFVNHTMIIEGAFMLLIMYRNPEDTGAWLTQRFGNYHKLLLLVYAVIYFVFSRVTVI